MTTRRQFLRYSVAAGAAGLLGSRGFSQVASKPTPEVTIYEGIYPGWPWIINAKDGMLYCVFREGTEHMYSATGRVMLTESADLGRSWTPARVIIDKPDVDDRNVNIAQLPNGNLLVAYNEYTADRESQAMTAQSADGGKTWSAPQFIGRGNTRTRAAAVPLSNGTILLPCYLAPGNGAVAALSKDNGATWRTIDLPNAEGFVGDEWDLLEMEPGRLVGISRNNHPQTDGFFWHFESRDYGETWSMPKKTNVQSTRHAAPAQLVRQNGAPTLIYPDRRMVSVSAVYSEDPSCVTWDLERRLPCYQYTADASPIKDGGYAVSAPLDARTRLIVDYEIRETTHRIAGYFVTFPGTWGKIKTDWQTRKL